MSKFTDFLNLFMWDSIEDSEEEFNIDKALNDNWKKIDTKVKTHVTSVNEEINNFKEETNQKIENIQALPVGGTKGQVLTKQSETNGDANWEDIEANEVFVGNKEEAPSSAKIIIEEDDFEESAGLSKAEVYVGAEEPTTGEKVWFRKGKNVFNTYSSDISYYLRNTDKEKYIINNSNSITVEGNGITWNRVEITISNLKPNTKYTINSIVTNTTQGYAGLYCDSGNNSVRHVNNKENFNTKITIITDENGKVKLQFFANYTSTVQNSSVIFSEIQLEEGEKATTYEAYIEPKLFVRNSNGVYEEFTKKSEEVYSTEEQVIGTWIDGKPLYRKVVEMGNMTKDNYKMKAHNIQNMKYARIVDVSMQRGNQSSGNFQLFSVGNVGGKYNDTQVGFDTYIDSNCVYVYCNGDRTLFVGTAIIEYTKTTD